MIQLQTCFHICLAIFNPMTEDPFEEARIKRKRNASGVLMVCFLLLFSVFWSVHSFFIWTFGGASVYFGFLYFYHRPREDNEAHIYEPDAPEKSAIPAQSRNIVLTMIFVSLGIIFVAFVIRLFGSSNDQVQAREPEPQNDSVARDDAKSPASDLVDRGNQFYNDKKLDSAFATYSLALKIDPENQLAQYGVALVYYVRDDSDKSKLILQKCTSQHPDFAEPFALLGYIYYNAKELDTALTYFNTAYDNGLRDPVFLGVLASLYEKNNPPKAIQFYKEALQQDSTNTEFIEKLIVLDSARADQYQKLKTK
jgi:tetratricopeptide (TPR) repeat protein